MEISGASSSAYKPVYDRPSAAKYTEGNAASQDEYMPQDTVDISPEAAQRAYAADDADDADQDDDDVDVDAADTAEVADTADTVNAEGKKEDVSTPKSFLYGALGLERPEKTEEKPTDGYQMGRWLAAGVTIGTIISVLV